MPYIDTVLSYIGEPYSIKTLDKEPVIYRLLPNGIEFEVSGLHSAKSSCSLYVWKTSPRELIGVYHKIKGTGTLKDFLGYCSTKYQNLIFEIQVERED